MPQPPNNAILRVAITTHPGTQSQRHTIIDAFHPDPVNGTHAERCTIMQQSTKVYMRPLRLLNDPEHQHIHGGWAITIHNLPEPATTTAIADAQHVAVHLWSQPLDDPRFTQTLIPALTNITIDHTTDDRINLTGIAEPTQYHRMPYTDPDDPDELTWDDNIAIIVGPTGNLPDTTTT